MTNFINGKNKLITIDGCEPTDLECRQLQLDNYRGIFVSMKIINRFPNSSVKFIDENFTEVFFVVGKSLIIFLID